ncbi:MAG TPA: right-handed parallel beta-helix repeat-containing protein [Planctomycetes bacterium]|nr:right-handed parallel beta-helix repeat-containing protein [Planctomycetota bacterium]HIL50690.1 right-handed parallel beta-helix repeat-containing protein [Planctomycetota bacterium]
MARARALAREKMTVKLPRWTTYPALAVLIGMAILAVPKPRRAPSHGAAARARAQRLELTDLKADQSQAAGFAILVRDFLPDGHVTDGSVDYRAEVQAVLDASSGEVVRLPNFPLRMDSREGTGFALMLPPGLRLEGSGESELVSVQPGIQLLRAEGVDGMLLENFILRGVDQEGRNMSHGLVQITGGTDLVMRGLRVVGADADGITVTHVSAVSVENCVVKGVSGAGIHLNDCAGGVVHNNRVSDFGGHEWGGQIVGAGIQLSSCRNIICSDNEISRGTGAGILCDTTSVGQAPELNVLRGNTIEFVNNPGNPAHSGGIRCINDTDRQGTGTRITGNRVRDCGQHGLYIEGHGGSMVRGNTFLRSARSALYVGRIDGLELIGNEIDGQQGSGGRWSSVELSSAATNVIQGPR